MSRFRQPPICEVCGKNEAVSFSYFEIEEGGQWKFTCDCTSDTESYYIRLDSFFGSAPSTVDWLAHVHEKTWMDWNDFMEMMKRFRGATNSFGSM